MVALSIPDPPNANTPPLCKINPFVIPANYIIMFWLSSITHWHPKTKMSKDSYEIYVGRPIEEALLTACSQRTNELAYGEHGRDQMCAVATQSSCLTFRT